MFIFSRYGEAVVAQNLAPPEEATVVERWFFEPTSLRRFLRAFGRHLLPRESTYPNNEFPEDYWVRDS
jgi:hypothetical protein